MIAKDIMSTNVITVGKETIIHDIAKLLTDKNISGVPVVDDSNNILGIITKNDLIYKDVEVKPPTYFEVLGGVFYLESIKHYEEKLKKFLANKAEDIMTEDVITITEDTDIKTIAGIMVEKRVNRLPVMKDGKLIGIISRGDIVKSLI